MMDTFRKHVGDAVELQTLARGVNVVGLSSQSSDIIDLHAKMFKKHGMTTIRNFDALNDIRNIKFSGECIHNAGLKHQTTITLMGLPPGLNTDAHSPKFYIGILKNILESGMHFDSLCFKDASGTCPPSVIYETVKQAREILDGENMKDIPIEMHTHDTADMSVQCYMAAIEGGAEIIDLAMRPMSGGTSQPDILTMWHAFKGTDYTLSYSDNVKVGTATATAAGIGACTGSLKTTFDIAPADMSLTSVTMPNLPYTGQAMSPQPKSVTYEVDGVTTELAVGVDYQVVGFTNNTNIGDATVVLQGMGNFTGTLIANWKIVQQGTGDAGTTLTIPQTADPTDLEGMAAFGIAGSMFLTAAGALFARMRRDAARAGR